MKGGGAAKILRRGASTCFGPIRFSRRQERLELSMPELRCLQSRFRKNSFDCCQSLVDFHHVSGSRTLQRELLHVQKRCSQNDQLLRVHRDHTLIQYCMEKQFGGAFPRAFPRPFPAFPSLSQAFPSLSPISFLPFPVFLKIICFSIQYSI